MGVGIASGVLRRAPSTDRLPTVCPSLMPRKALAAATGTERNHTLWMCHLNRSLRAIFDQAFGSIRHFAQNAFCRLDTQMTHPTWQSGDLRRKLRPKLQTLGQ